MEIGLTNDIPTYSGGLGIIAGDTLKSGADLGLPMIAVSLVSRRGYFRQDIDSGGRQIEHPDDWDPSKLLIPLKNKVAVKIQGSDVKIRAWLYSLRSLTGGLVPVLFL